MDWVFIILAGVGCVFVGVMALLLVCYPLYTLIICYNFFSCPCLGVLFDKCRRKKRERVWYGELGARPKERRYREQADYFLVEFDNINQLKAKTKLKTKKLKSGKHVRVTSDSETEKLLEPIAEETAMNTEVNAGSDSSGTLSDENAKGPIESDELQSVVSTEPETTN
ncbi:protein O14 [Cercopithecine betaherpesvirus 5]|uniref:Protein O14 n=1 Tax=Simian cytomegalovirus (strain Colburn) TaxID=50292 RepID=G8XTJ8_SCMVC|nr:protein O14 [Cercopithecine betaherpesvirus 5]AEV80490.1 protein O14 [Cercopithecine betaherpesvirus 5]